MHTRFTTPVAMTAQATLAGFDRRLFEQLRPAGVSFFVDRFDGCNVGDEVHLRIGLPGLMTAWISQITEAIKTDGEVGFVDEGRVLPFVLRSWRHQHRLVERPYGCDIIDEIHYTCPLPGLALLLLPGLRFSFAGRKSVYQRVFGKPEP